MVKKMLGVILLASTLTACEHTHSWAQTFAFMQPIKEGASEYDFNWRLSGDREVAPLQVFSAGQQLWLQFAVEQNIPAIFALENGRHIPLSYKRSDPYVIIKGNWQHLVFRGAALQAQARYQAPTLSPSLASTDVNSEPSTHPVPTASDLQNTVSVVEPTPLIELPHSTPLKVAPSHSSVANSAQGRASNVVAHSAETTSSQQSPALSVMTKGMSSEKNVLPPETTASSTTQATSFAIAEMPFSVGPNDGTMRQALKRWAQRAGWVFLDQHWGLEVDLPIVSAALFSADFNDAVTQLMRSTALGTRPLQACMYSNKVLRVIPLAQHCDPSLTVAHSS